MNRQSLLDDAIREMQARSLLFPEASIESTLELFVGGRPGATVLRQHPDSRPANFKDASALRMMYPQANEPLGVVLCGDRDLACSFDPVLGELVIEASHSGEERLVVVAASGFTCHGLLDRLEEARIALAGLAREETYQVGLFILRSADSVFAEAEELYRERGPKTEILTLIDRSLMLNPSHARAWRRKAYILRQAGRSEEALASAEESVRVDPEFALGWRCKGAILRDRGEHQQGLDCYLRSLALDPTDSVCWSNKGNALSALGRGEEARQAYDEADRIGALYPRDSD